MNNSSTVCKCGTSERRDGNDEDYRQGVWIFVVVCFVISIGANILILVVVKRTPSMHSVTNILLCNLAVSDLVYLLWPLVGVDTFKLSGNFSCKFTWSIPTIVFVCSLLTMSLIAVERCQALVNAMASSTFRLTLHSVKYSLLAVWSLAMLGAIPVVLLLEYDVCGKKGGVHTACRIVSGSNMTLKALTVAYAVLVTFVPMIITCYCYFKIVSGVCISKTILSGTSASNEEVQMRTKLVQISVIAATAFVLCYAPVGIIAILFYLDALRPNFFSERATVAMYMPGCVKAVINPFLYAFQSTNHRTAVKSMFRCCQNKNIQTRPQDSQDFEIN